MFSVFDHESSSHRAPMAQTSASSKDLHRTAAATPETGHSSIGKDATIDSSASASTTLAKSFFSIPYEARTFVLETTEQSLHVSVLELPHFTLNYAVYSGFL